MNEDRAFEADVYIEGGVIKEVGQNLTASSECKVIDATGKLILPGLLSL